MMEATSWNILKYIKSHAVSEKSDSLEIKADCLNLVIKIDK